MVLGSQLDTTSQRETERENLAAETLSHSQSGTPQRDREFCCAHLVSLYSQPVRYYVERQSSFLRTPCFIIASPVLRRETENFAANTLLHYSQSGIAQRDREFCCSHLASLQPVRYCVERHSSFLLTPCFIIASPVFGRETEQFSAHTLLHHSQSGIPQRDRSVFCAHLASLYPVRYCVERQSSFLRTPCFIIPSPVLRRETEQFSAHILLHYSQSGIA